MRKLPKQNDPYLEAEVLNFYTFQDFFYRLSRIALSIFEWENLPISMDEEWLEECLFMYGQAALLYSDDWGGFINTQSTTHGDLNIYNKPISLECYGIGKLHLIRDIFNGLSDPGKKEDECILVENMYGRIPTISGLQLYAMRLAECMRSEDVNIKQQKFPLFIPADQKQLFTIQNVYKQYSGNTPIIIGDKNGIGLDQFKVVNTEAPFVADKLQQYRLKIFNEALSWLGISNLNEKKERQLTDEINKNNEEVNLNLQAFLIPRQRAAKLFNIKYGFENTDKEVKVKVRSDLYNIIKQEQSVITDLKTEDITNE